MWRRTRKIIALGVGTIGTAILWIWTGAKWIADLIGRTTVIEDTEATATKMEKILDFLLAAPWWTPVALATLCTLALIVFMFWVGGEGTTIAAPSGESADVIRARVKLEQERRQAKIDSTKSPSNVSVRPVNLRTLTKKEYEDWDKVDPLHLWQAACLWAGLHVSYDVQRFESPGYVKFSMLLRAVEQETLHTLEATHELWQVQIARDALKNFAEAIDEKPAFLFPEAR